jgi:hypothetical protein
VVSQRYPMAHSHPTDNFTALERELLSGLLDLWVAVRGYEPLKIIMACGEH